MVFPSSMTHKVEKAARYAAEGGERVHFDAFQVIVKGDNDDHQVTYNHGEWSCDCSFFQNYKRCAHTMTMENVLTKMIE